jgi:hypothetical protein
MIASTQLRATAPVFRLPGKPPVAAPVGSAPPASAGGVRRGWAEVGLLGIGLLAGLLLARSAAIFPATHTLSASAPSSWVAAAPAPIVDSLPAFAYSAPAEPLSGLVSSRVTADTPAEHQLQVAAQAAALHEVLDDLGPLLSSP